MTNQPMYIDAPGYSAAGGVDLRTFLSKLVAQRWWVVASVVCFTAAFTAAASVMTPYYRATALLIPASAERSSLSGSLGSALGQIGGIASLAGVSIGGVDAATEESLAVLRSREFTDKFIADQQLMPILYADSWDGATGSWKPDKKVPTPAKAFKYFDDAIRTVVQDKKTGLVTLRIDWKDRNLAAQWANELVTRLNAEMRARAVEKAEASISFLEKELPDTSVVETRQAINQLIEAQVKQRMIATVTKEFAFRFVDRAVAADKDDPVKPRKMVLRAMGIALGLLVGIGAALLRSSLKKPNHSRSN